MSIDRRDLEFLLTQAEVKLVGASRHALLAEFFDVLHEFFDTTSAWREDIPFTIKPAQQSYRIDPAKGGKIIRLYQVMDFNNIPWPAVLLDPSRAGPPGGSSFGPISTNQQPNPTSEIGFNYVYLQNQFTAPLNVATAGGNVLTASVIKNVYLREMQKGVPLAPDWLIPTHHIYLQAGLIGKMMTQPNKPYTNDAKGTYELKRFRDGMAMVRAAVARANTVGAQNWKFPQAWRTRNQKGGVSVGAETGWGF